jgi:pimeloyl-ACP methyl ester carboxylesterase
MIAQEFALSYPDMVKGLVLYATDCGPASSSRLLRLSLVLIRILCVVAPWHTRGFLGEACAISFWKGTAGRLGDIRCPVLLLKGEADFLMRTQVTREMHAAIPGSRMICIPHGGHRWHDQCPDRFMHMVTEFFQDIPDSTVSDA